MKVYNRALSGWLYEKAQRFSAEQISENDSSCIFISYQREDEKYAEEIANYILNKSIDVYFDKNDHDLRLASEAKNPNHVTGSIKKGLDKSTHLLALVSSTSYKSYWIPFEIGYSYEKIGSNQKVLKHKDIGYLSLPDYLRTRTVITGYEEFDKFLQEVYNSKNVILERRNKLSPIKAIGQFSTHRLSSVLSK